MAALRTFDFVGRTEELEMLIRVQASTLCWELKSMPPHQNPTQPKYLEAMGKALGNVTSLDRMYIVHGKGVLNDMDLYRTFCPVTLVG